jgi:hypothetical protein
MAELILRPDDVIDQGEWSLEGGELIDALSDSSDITKVFNTNGNQSMTLSMTDIPEPYSEETFTSLTVTVHAGPTGKGAASTAVGVYNGEEVIGALNCAIESDTEITAYTSEDIDVAGMSLETLNSLHFQMTGLDDTQAFYSEVFFTLTYSLTVQVTRNANFLSGYINLSQGKVTI